MRAQVWCPPCDMLIPSGVTHKRDRDILGHFQLEDRDRMGWGSNLVSSGGASPGTSLLQAQWRCIQSCPPACKEGPQPRCPRGAIQVVSMALPVASSSPMQVTWAPGAREGDQQDGGAAHACQCSSLFQKRFPAGVNHVPFTAGRNHTPSSTDTVVKAVSKKRARLLFIAPILYVTAAPDAVFLVSQEGAVANVSFLE